MNKIIKLLLLIVIFYQSQLVAQTKKVSGDWTSFVQAIEVKTDRTIKFKLQGWAKVIGHKQDSTIKAGLWARVDTNNDETGFFDNMDDRPIISDQWKEYEIIGELDKNANKLNFGGIAHYNGTFYFDDFKLYLENENGDFMLFPIKNNGFELDELLAGWGQGISPDTLLEVKEFTYNLASDHKDGKQSLRIKGKNITKPLTKETLKTWYHKDYTNDSIPGVSLEKAYEEILNTKMGQEVIVAVLDTKLDIHHEDLKDQIWYNTNETPDNNIDDDKNGYIDDINGWDFLSNREGEFVVYEQKESTRILKKYDAIFKGKKPEEIPNKLMNAYKMYTSAYQKREKNIAENKETLKNIKKWKEIVVEGEKLLDSIYPKNEYTTSELDSLITIYKKDPFVQYKITGYRDAIKYELSKEYLNEFIEELEHEKETMLNLDYNERAIIGDDVNNIHDNKYGSPIVYGDVPFPHATVVAGTLAANRSNNLGVKGFSDYIKIMPVVMVASGDENDKDVALAIRYAVDNGAKVINMSWGKTLSLHEDWVNDAIKYAADNDVLLITAGGNDNSDNDLYKYYLNDYNNEKEFVENFIVVGASTWNPKNLKASFSNYGKKHVDIFAPGMEIYTTEYGKNKYTTTEGTSLASPIVAGIAALIRSYYPKLSAKQVKQILMDSGTLYDVDVEVKHEDGTKKLVHFSELSKSGKIVNAYNALVLAEQISKEK
ncbi:S8 family serine peptidase [uncultured Aquimarina sp.]|uniref:S8 family serine peptidase n=1 Tax=uncultured Aquimarina sp. TaxID=575652 RepID=UPI002602935D|nr:S8 family serine peptidase [uncultured Aquimarina sp.]